MTSIVIRWHAKVEPHNNLVVIHTRGEAVQEYLEFTIGAKRDGSRFILESKYVELAVEQLTQAGFIVG